MVKQKRVPPTLRRHLELRAMRDSLERIAKLKRRQLRK